MFYNIASRHQILCGSFVLKVNLHVQARPEIQRQNLSDLCCVNSVTQLFARVDIDKKSSLAIKIHHTKLFIKVS